jgi:hypothetical protein
MKTKLAVVVVALAASLVASDVLAQPGGGRGGRGRGGFGGFGGFGGVSRARIAQVEAVQAELKLSDGAKEKLVAMQEELQEQRRAARGQGGFGGGGFQDMSAEERAEFFANFQKRQAEATKQEVAKLAEILDEAQMKRLTSIFVQQAGVAAMMDPVISEQLKITDEQKTELQAISQEGGEAMRDLRPRRGAAPTEEQQKEIANLTKEIEEAALAELNDEQKKQYVALKGDVFEMPADALRGRGGRGGQGGRGGNRGNN